LTSEVLKESAGAPNAIDLALDRTHMAYERTLMAWIRTAASLISFGFTVYKFFEYLGESTPGGQSERFFGVREFAFSFTPWPSCWPGLSQDLGSSRC
jgi:uncharacterized membrane protein YidH (DUF202 family)